MSINLKKAAVFLLFVFLCSSLTFSQKRKKKKKPLYAPIENVEAAKIWPIVVQVVNSNNLSIEEFDYAQGKLKSSYYKYRKGIVPNRGKILFTLKETTLHIDVVELQLQDAQTKKWKPTYPDPLFPKEKQIKASMSDGLKGILANPDQIALAMTGFKNNIVFHQKHFNQSTELASKIWFKKFLLDQEVSWNLKLADIKEGGKYGKAYTESFEGITLERGFKVIRYTDSEKNAFSNKGTRVAVTGVCKEILQDEAGVTLILSDK